VQAAAQEAEAIADRSEAAEAALEALSAEMATALEALEGARLEEGALQERAAQMERQLGLLQQVSDAAANELKTSMLQNDLLDATVQQLYSQLEGSEAALVVAMAAADKAERGRLAALEEAQRGKEEHAQTRADAEAMAARLQGELDTLHGDMEETMTRGQDEAAAVEVRLKAALHDTVSQLTVTETRERELRTAVDETASQLRASEAAEAELRAAVDELHTMVDHLTTQLDNALVQNEYANTIRDGAVRDAKAGGEHILELEGRMRALAGFEEELKVVREEAGNLQT